MEVRTLFFARYREIFGTAELGVEIPQGATVGDLVSNLRARGGGFGALPEEPVVALNRSYASLSAPLRAGDEVAFIPPVAGG